MRNLFGVLVLIISVLVFSGCSSPPNIVKRNLLVIGNESQFDSFVLNSRGLVLVEFYKDSCPTCVVQERVLEHLGGRYGRVTFAKFKIRNVMMGGLSRRIRDIGRVCLLSPPLR